jgi:hypothetical protein
VLVISLMAVPVWSSEGPSDQVSQRWSSWFSAQGLQASAKPVETPWYRASVTPTSYAPPVAPANVRELARETDGPRTQGILASTTWLKGAFAAETEVANNQGGNNIPGDTQADPAGRMMRLNLAATSGPARYGVTYRTAGEAFYNGSDQALKEVWGEWKQGRTTLRTAVGQQWNNVAGDPGRARLEQNYSRVGLSWNKALWPQLAVTYTQTALNSAPDATGLAPQKTNNHSLEATLGYGGAVWNAGLASSYILGSDLSRNGSDNRVKLQTVTASLRPLNTLTITPTLGFRTEQQEWSGVRIDSPSAALTMNYKQSQRLLVSAMGNYSGVRSSDRLIDTENIGGKGILAWDLQQSRGWTTLMSLEGGYDRQTNRVMSSTETQDISGLLRFVLSPL